MNPNKRRKVVGYDNLGEPVYEGDADGDTLDVLGTKLKIDAFSASLIIFAVIAFQFFVVANL